MGTRSLYTAATGMNSQLRMVDVIANNLANVNTGGGGVIGMTADDTAVFNVRSPHAGVSEIAIGSASATFPEHRQLCVAQKRANGDTFELEMHKVLGSGMPIPFTEQEFSIPELNMKLVYDSERDEVAKIRAKRAS